MKTTLTNEVRAEYKALCASIEEHNDLYYKKGTPKISDFEYDALYAKLVQMEKDHPELKSAKSPTQKVGSDATTGFKKVKHAVPMLSIDNVYELRDRYPYDDLRKWVLHTESPNLIQNYVLIEPKIDGCAVTLMYEKGKLKYAATRGTGAEGDDITANILTIKSIPRELPGKPEEWPEIIEVRGEVYMETAAFQKMNEALEAEGKPVLANPRNATAGAIKSLDPAEVAKKPLKFLAHGIGQFSNPNYLTNVSAYYDLMNMMGIPCLEKLSTHCPIRAVYNGIDSLRKCIIPKLPFNTDGAVIKLWNWSDREQLGCTSRAPRWAAAFKFLPEQKATKLTGITLQIGRTGVITPVAELEPIQLAGTTVSRATLHNQDNITEKDIRIGDTVIVEKSGEIIPAVVGVNLNKRPAGTTPYNILEATDGKCPRCGAPLEREEGKVAIKCTNMSCPAQLVANTLNLCHKEALDIENVGPELVEALVFYQHIGHPLDLLELNIATLQDVVVTYDEETDTSTRLGTSMAVKIVEAIDRADSLPLDRWIKAIGIPGVGSGTARKLTQCVKDWDDFFTGEFITTLHECLELIQFYTECDPKAKANANADAGQLELLRQGAINSMKNLLLRNDYEKRGYFSIDFSKKTPKFSAPVGPAVINNVFRWLSSNNGKVVADTFLEWNEFNPKSENYIENLSTPTEGKLSGLTIVITGTLTQDRSHYVRLIEEHGGKVGSSISKKTTHLLAGENCGSKLDKATQLGTTIISEATFLEMING